MVVILGGGVSGISAGYHLSQQNVNNVVYDKRPTWGGLCDNFIIGEGFIFDYFVHLSFSKDTYVNELLLSNNDHITHKALSRNYYNGYWLKHPAQYNLAPLPDQVKVKIMIDFINKPNKRNPKNYAEWLLSQYGEYFSERFSKIYTLKYWGMHAKDLSLEWLGNRFSVPSKKEMLTGILSSQADNYYYASEMKYPVNGGYKSFFENMANRTNIKLNKEAIEIDTKNRKIFFSDNTSTYYEKLVSSIPLPELINIIKDVPEEVKIAADSLLYTSGQLVSIGFNRPDVPKDLWFYIYDEDILPARAYSPSLKSPNNSPAGKSSMQFETYCSRRTGQRNDGDSLIEHVIDKAKVMDLFDLEDIEVIDYRDVKYANVIFDHDRKMNVGIIHKFLKNSDVSFIGRFGEWDYLWSDQSIISGKKVADKIAV